MSSKRALETFNSKSLKIQNKKHQDKLVNGQDVFLIQPGGSGKFESFVLEHQLTKSTRREIGLNFELAGLKITAGQRTMSGLIEALTGQTFDLPVMLTGQN